MTNEELIDSFNNGRYGDDIEPYFNDVKNFFNYALKNDFLTELDFEYIPHSELDTEMFNFLVENGVNFEYLNAPIDLQNHILLYNLEKNREETLKYVCDNLVTDVHIRNGGYYLYLRDREEMAGLFSNSSRDTSPRDVAKAVLGEDGWDSFWDTTDDVYGDVIEELNEENIYRLAHYIIKNIGNQELSLDDYNADFFSDISEDQKTEGFFKITSENVNFLIKDSEAMNELLKNDLSDLKSELYSIHNNAYNNAYETEIYEMVWDELKTFFEDKIENEKREIPGGSIRYDEYIKIRDFYSFVYDWAVEHLGEGWSDSVLEYEGYYINNVAKLMDNGVYEWLSFRIPDYPGWSLTKKYINEFFGDYI